MNAKKACAIVGSSEFVQELVQMAQMLDYERIDTYTEEAFSTDLLPNCLQYDQVVLAAQDPRLNLSFFKSLKSLGAKMPPLIHPRACIGHSQIGEASIIGLGVQLQDDCQVGVCTVINAAVVIENRCFIGDGVYIGAHTGLGEGACIEDLVWLGRGSLVMANRRVGEASSIGAGSFIMEDIEPDSVVDGEGMYGMTEYCSCCY